MSDAWQVLDIAPTEDIHVIKKAYAAKLKRTKPQNDALGYQHLRKAYDAAMVLARSGSSNLFLDIRSALITVEESPVHQQDQHGSVEPQVARPLTDDVLLSHAEHKPDQCKLAEPHHTPQAPLATMQRYAKAEENRSKPRADPFSLSLEWAQGEALTLEALIAEFDVLLVSEVSTQQHGIEWLSMAQRVPLADQGRLADLTLNYLLSHRRVIPMDWMNLLDQHFGWSRDARWSLSIDEAQSERLILVLAELRRARQAERRDGQRQATSMTRLPDRQEPVALHDGRKQAPWPPGWEHLAAWVRLSNWRVSRAIAVQLWVVIALAFPLLARTLHKRNERSFRHLIWPAWTLHLLMWWGVMTGSGILWGMTWEDALMLSGCGLLYGGALYGVFGWVSRNWTRPAEATMLVRWCSAPWRAWALMLTPAVLALLALYTESPIAALALVVLTFIVAYFARDTVEWMARPGLNGRFLLFGAGLLLVVLMNPLPTDTGLGTSPGLVLLPFVLSLVALSVASASPKVSRGSRKVYPHLAASAVLGLVIVNLEVARWGMWSQAVWHVNAAAVSVVLLAWLLWRNSARYSNVFWLISLVIAGLWGHALTTVHASIQIPLVTVVVLALLLVSGLQGLADRVALGIVRRGLDWS
ncbi:hypothetical protein ACFIQG_13955 [Comamonas odontotermitis]|uniref:hypothetical protein n=1 Tax=Comamonas odontotermitis TaxID=379895 RepID=UPI00366E5B1D